MCGCDLPAISDTTNIKAARKPHCCSECYKPIEVGQPYQRYDALFDGSWGHSKFCLACQEAWKTAWAMMDCACDTPIGDLWNALDDYGLATPYWRYEHYRERAAH